MTSSGRSRGKSRSSRLARCRADDRSRASAQANSSSLCISSPAVPLIPFVIEHTVSDVRIVVGRTNVWIVSAIRIDAVWNHDADPVAGQKDAPYACRLIAVVARNLHVFGLVPDARCFAAHLFVLKYQPAHGQLQVRLPFERIAGAAGFFASTGGAAILANRHDIGTATANTGPRRP